MESSSSSSTNSIRAQHRPSTPLSHTLVHTLYPSDRVLVDERTRDSLDHLTHLLSSYFASWKILRLLLSTLAIPFPNHTPLKSTLSTTGIFWFHTLNPSLFLSKTKDFIKGGLCSFLVSISPCHLTPRRVKYRRVPSCEYS
jgi:hypothetical protein